MAVVRRALEHRRLIVENRGYQANLESLVADRTDLLKKAIVDLERSYDMTMEALGAMLGIKDAETERALQARHGVRHRHRTGHETEN